MYVQNDGKEKIYYDYVRVNAREERILRTTCVLACIGIITQALSFT